MRTKNPQLIAAIESFVNAYLDEHGCSPSLQEIAEGTGMSMTNAHRYVSSMRESGALSSSGAHRSIVTSGGNAKTVRVPVLGAVACGLPKLAQENITEYVRLPVSLFGQGEFYILAANGDSMIDAGISDGDLVLIRRQDCADEGQIVVALIEDEATLKRFYPEPDKHRVRLHPENSALDDIFADDCVIQGVAVKVLKNLA